MAHKKSDIELEMSRYVFLFSFRSKIQRSEKIYFKNRFEEEIGRLAPRQVTISAPPVQSITIKALPSMAQYQPLAAAAAYPMQIKLPTTYTSIGRYS